MIYIWAYWKLLEKQGWLKESFLPFSSFSSAQKVLVWGKIIPVNNGLNMEKSPFVSENLPPFSGSPHHDVEGCEVQNDL